MRGYGPIYYIIEAYHGFRSNSLVNLLAMGTISMAMLIVGFFLVVFMNLQTVVSAMGERLEISVYLKEGVTKVKPQVDLLAPLSKSLFARATMDISVTARLVSTKNGATVWTESVTREGTVGSVGMSGGVPVFSVRDKDEATSDLLRDIMYNMTWDFRPTRQRL